MNLGIMDHTASGQLLVFGHEALQRSSVPSP